MNTKIDKKRKPAVKKPIVRFSENPFLEDLVVPIKGRQVRLSRIGKSSENVLVNTETGEEQGTHVVTYKRVDAEEFIKLFTANIALTFSLSSAGIKALGVLTFAAQRQALSKDLVVLDTHTLAAFLEENEKLSLSQPTFSRGLGELEKAGIIARNVRQGFYFLNPNFIFNGDRIAFTTVIERKRKGTAEKLEEQGQQRLCD